MKERQVYKHISILKSLGVIVRVGSNKTGYWKVNILKEYIYVESRREDA